MSSSMDFADLDDKAVYEECSRRVLQANALNFVVSFGREKANIKFDFTDAEAQQLLDQVVTERAERPVRWINIWEPHLQPETLRAVALHYGFSERLQAILMTPPLPKTTHDPEEKASCDYGSEPQRLDPEKGGVNNVSPELSQGANSNSPDEANHYTIASHLTNYQSVDIGEKCKPVLCVGANWMHRKANGDRFENASFELRIWSWLVMCDDGTIISIYEDHGLDDPSLESMKAIRGHTCRILSQLTEAPIPKNTSSVGLISVRRNLQCSQGSDEMTIGNDGASNLFYYLFDDWHNSYHIIRDFQKRLEKISSYILSNLDSKPSRNGRSSQSGAEIIKSLYTIGRQLRTNEHMHEGYSNLIKRILEYKPPAHHSPPPPSASSATTTGATHHRRRRVVLSQSAADRFERLGDRIRLLVVSSLRESVLEKDALMSTYFNITAQIDSAATAKLTKSAALLSKLGVLFLPVSLMTAYFSVQIQELEGVYTARTYWVSFAVVVVLSTLALFFFSSWLVNLTEWIEDAGKSVPRRVGRQLAGMGERRGRRAE